MDVTAPPTLLAQLAEIAAEAQRAQSVRAVLEAAGMGLWRIGLRLAVMRVLEGVATLEYFCDPKNEVTWLRPAVGAGTSLSGLLLPSGPISQVLTQNRPVYFGDLTSATLAFLGKVRGAQSAELEAAIQHAGIGQGIVVPVSVRGQPWGVLLVSSGTVRADDANALFLFSAQLGSALETADTIERLERRTRELEALRSVATTDDAAGAEPLAEALLAIAARTTDSDYGVIYLLEEGAGLVRLGHPYGYTDPELMKRYDRMSAEATHTGQAAKTARPRALSVADLPPEISKDLAAHGFQQFCMVPLQHGGVRGTLNLVRARPHPYAQEEVRFAEILAGQVALRIENARLNDEQRLRVEELRASYERLERTQKELVLHERLAALGELAATMAHELRNPLGAIFNSLSSLRRMRPKPASAAGLEGIISEEADRLNRIVGDLLDFARPYNMERAGVAVESLVAGAVEAAAHVAREASVTVRTDVQAGLPEVSIDPRMLRQALLNLILNAVQASPREGHVHVRALLSKTAAGSSVCIEVEDAGPGVPPELEERVFQPFFTTKPTGTGLGLPIVVRILEAHGGTTELTSFPGKGAVFRVRLPAT